MTEEQAEQAPEFNPIKEIQDILARVDPSAMLSGFVVVAEWLEEDGQNALSVTHTPASPWHLHGMLTYARDHHCSATYYGYVDETDEEDDE